MQIIDRVGHVYLPGKQKGRSEFREAPHRGSEGNYSTIAVSTANGGRQSCLTCGGLAGAGVLGNRCNKRLEERAWPVGPRGEFRMELAAYHKGMVGDLADFDQAAIGRNAGVYQALVAENLPIGIIEFEP